MCTSVALYGSDEVLFHPPHSANSHQKHLSILEVRSACTDSEEDIQSECHDGVTQALTRVAVISSGGCGADVCSVNQELEFCQVKQD